MRWPGRLMIGLVLVAWYVPAAAAGPALNIVTPTNGAVIEGDSITVTFTTANITLVKTSVPVSEAGKRPEANRAGEGHLHFVLDLQPLVVWESSAPYTFTHVPPGEHRLLIELVNNDHSPFAPPVVRHVQFRSGPPMALPASGSAPAGASGLLVVVALVLAAAGFAFRRRLFD